MPVVFNLDLLLAIPCFPPMDGPVLAYIDPGTGSILLQVLVAGFAGCAVLMSMFWRNIKRFFGFSRAERKEEAALRETPDGDSTE